jgi:ketosteroid isomerase-like protein
MAIVKDMTLEEARIREVMEEWLEAFRAKNPERIRGKSFDGNEVDVWSRSTACLRKIDGQWKIAHEHSSVPIDMVTGKGIMDLEP